MRYDAAILGAGPDGLAAAARLARAGLKTVLIARDLDGICTTREFHPGFSASLYRDELSPIPVGVFWSLDLARRGVLFAPAATPTDDAARRLIARAKARVATEVARADAVADRPVERAGWLARLLHREPLALPDAPDSWAQQSLVEATRDLSATDAQALMARALAGRTADPFLRGTALHLLAPGLGDAGMVAGGLATLTQALAAAAREAGAEIVLDQEAGEIQREKGKIVSVTLADGTAIEAAAVISTIDLKRTILSLFTWADLPDAVVKRAAHLRMSGSTARLLVALDARPEVAQTRAVIHTASSAEEFAAADAAWRAHLIPDCLPASLRLVSAVDPRLAPHGKAVVTVTLGAIPHKLFDAGWTPERREALRSRALALVAENFPDAPVLGSELLLPSDMEAQLGATDGDLLGGEIAADQMFANRSFAGWPRTPIAGLYLAGPSSSVGPCTTCAAGWLAAKALIADHRAGRFA